MKTKKTTKPKQITTGKDYEAEEKMLESEVKATTTNASSRPAVKTLDEIWGFQKKSKFPASSEGDYREYLATLNISDLQQECFKNEILPRERRETMTNSLVKAFRTHEALAATANIQAAPPISGDIYKIMEGRI